MIKCQFCDKWFSEVEPSIWEHLEEAHSEELGL